MISKYGAKGERPSGRILAHNHVRHSVNMPHGANGFRCWYDFLDLEIQKTKGFFRRISKDDPDGPRVHYVRCKCGWRPDLGIHYRVRGMESADYRCDSIEAIQRAQPWG
jgi:hypothetical protein